MCNGQIDQHAHTVTVDIIVFDHSDNNKDEERTSLNPPPTMTYGSSNILFHNMFKNRFNFNTCVLLNVYVTLVSTNVKHFVTY